METETSDSFNFAIERMTRPEAAKYIGTSDEFLEQDVTSRRHGIPFIKIGRKVTYLKSDLDAWVMSRRIA
jgi:excisionase family DNA binding protein